VPLIIFMNNSHENAIEEKVESLGGELIDIDDATFKNDPFKWYEHGKNVYIYKFTFDVNGEEHVGWVNFSFGEIWIIDGVRED
jgi:hypothetical protein